jgi:CRISPR system Cascade subunit CasE
MSDAQLFMVRAEFDQPALIRFAAHSSLPLRLLDDGYVLHAATRALFGDAAPRPFVVRPANGRRLTVLGYAGRDHRALVELARATADPLAVSAVDLDSLCSKAMPSSWRAGAVYGFEARVCPVVRISGRAAGGRPRETDAFIHQCLRVGAGIAVDRQEVYREWLAGELGRGAAARMRRAKLVRFQRKRLSRRDRSNGRAGLHRCERPDATLEGVLEVASAAAFDALLRRGLGRHRAFGFGMLLLRAGVTDA